MNTRESRNDVTNPGMFGHVLYSHIVSQFPFRQEQCATGWDRPLIQNRCGIGEKITNIECVIVILHIYHNPIHELLIRVHPSPGCRNILNHAERETSNRCVQLKLIATVHEFVPTNETRTCRRGTTVREST